MCGIAGFFSTDKLLEPKRFAEIGTAMADALHHRGPDAGGLWQGEDTPIALAHRRLAIIDLTEEGAQPMASPSGRYIMVYNGEIYNFQELRKDLEAAGAAFRGRSDSEVFLAGCDIWGLNMTLQKINGMFAIALWDRQKKQLHLIKDRLGKKPLYVGWAGKTLVFGSELKALHAHPEFKADINRDALAGYMRLSYVPAPQTIYKKVWQLLPGHRMVLDVSALRPGENLRPIMEPYWHHKRVIEEAQARPVVKPDHEIVDEFEALLQQCVSQRMISDVALGAFLSGGIDSSAVVALMQKSAARPVKTYTIGFEEAGFNEAKFAKKVASHLGTDHHELYLSADNARDVIPSLTQMYDEPFADISQIPTYLVSKFARQDVTVALSGDGGDEMLGGYNRHVMGPKLLKAMHLVPPPLRGIVAAAIKGIPTSALDKLAPSRPDLGAHLHKVAGILPLKTRAAIYQSLCSQWKEPQSLVLQSTEPLSLYQQSGYSAEELSFAEEMMAYDAMSYLPGDILTKVDRASMAVSLEARAPLLDRRIYEYCWSLPMTVKIREGQGKWLLRQVLGRHVPEELFERPKQGFSVPVAQWLRGPLKEWAAELLDKDRLKREGYLNAELVHKTWDAHQAGQGRHGQQLWNILMFQSWLEQWS